MTATGRTSGAPLRPSRLFSFLASVVGRLPWSWLPSLGAVLAFLAFDVLRIRRRHVLSSLGRVGGGSRDARAMFRGLGASALELLWLASARRRAVDAATLVRIVNRERFDEALSLGRGVIVATAHTGNWDLAACGCAALTPLTVVTKRLSSPAVDAWWQAARASRGVDLLAAPDGNVLAAARARLGAGRALALLVDQDPERMTSVVEAPFLGEVAVHDTFAATLAARTGAPIVVAFARRGPPRAPHEVVVVDVLTPPARAGRAWIEEATRAIAAHLDAFVRAEPARWLWLHRRWKTRLPERRALGSDARPHGAQVPRTHFMPGGHSDGPPHW